MNLHSPSPLINHINHIMDPLFSFSTRIVTLIIAFSYPATHRRCPHVLYNLAVVDRSSWMHENACYRTTRSISNNSRGLLTGCNGIHAQLEVRRPDNTQAYICFTQSAAPQPTSLTYVDGPSTCRAVAPRAAPPYENNFIWILGYQMLRDVACMLLEPMMRTRTLNGCSLHPELDTGLV